MAEFWVNAPTSYVAVGELTSPKFCRAFSEGCGGCVVLDGMLRPGPIAAFGSPKLWNMLRQARNEGRDWYYGDHAYFGRSRFYRVTRNAWQHDGRGNSGYDRLKRLGVEISPWKKSGTHVLICPPDEIFSSLMGFDNKEWLSDTLNILKNFTDRQILVRDRCCARGPTPLSSDLADCWALVTYMSNAAVEAVCAGIPVFCSGQCAARRMGETDLSKIESPAYPGGRKQWAANLAANQWTLSEISSGQCWKEIGR